MVGQQWAGVQVSAEGEHRHRSEMACDLTVAIDDSYERGMIRIDRFLKAYCDVPGRNYPPTPGLLRRPGRGSIGLGQGLCRHGASHICLRFAGDHNALLEAMATLRERMGG